MEKEKGIKVSMSTYNKIKRIAKYDKRTIKAVVDLAIDQFAKSAQEQNP